MLNVTIDMSKEDFMASIPSAENHIIEVEEMDVNSLAEHLIDFCESHLCHECPFRQLIENSDYWGCKINTPYKWKLDKSE